MLTILGAIILGFSPAVDDLDQAVALWKQFDMPVPSRDCVPVKITSNNENWSLGLVDKPAQGPEVFYQGTNILKIEKGSFKTLPWDAKEAIGVSNRFLDFEEAPEDTVLAAAIQCQIVGRTSFAAQLLQQRNAYDWNAFKLWVGLPRDKSALAGTAMLIATHYANQIRRSGSNWQLIERKLTEVRKLGLLNFMDSLIDGLRESMKPPSAAKGTPKRAIEELIQCYYKNSGVEEARKAILSYGIDAIPALYEMRNSPALTSEWVNPDGPTLPNIRRMGGEALTMILSLAKGELGTHGIRERDIMPWYMAKKGGDFEKYLSDHLVDEHIYDGVVYRQSSDYAFQCMYARYPELLAKSYEKLINQRPIVDCWSATQYLAKSGVTDSEKKRLLLLAVRSDDFYHKRAAFENLPEFAPREYEIEMLKALDSFGGNWTGFTEDPRGNLIYQSQTTKSLAIWKALMRLAKRSEPLLRQYIVESIRGRGGPWDKDYSPELELRFLAEFLNDKAEPARSSDRDERMSIGRSALLTAANILDPSIDRSGPHTEEKWKRCESIVTNFLLKLKSPNPFKQ